MPKIKIIVTTEDESQYVQLRKQFWLSNESVNIILDELEHLGEEQEYNAL